MYPNSNPDELPDDDFKRLTHIDNLWIVSLKKKVCLGEKDSVTLVQDIPLI